ncbi:MAG: triose-phosphate isomerase [Nanoarchaeota archaeon]
MRLVVIINFKTYEQATGKNAVKLAKICEQVAKSSKADIRIAVQPTDLAAVVKAVKIPVYAQHIDSYSYGKFTGFITAEAVKAAGAKGTLLNHSEHRLKLDEVEDCVKRAKKLGLVTVLCANDPLIGQALATLKPDFIAIEPPELIGGTISVSEAEPEVIKDIVKRIGKKERILVGAGVHTGKDVHVAHQLGAAGVLLASGVTIAKDPRKVLKNLVSK